MPFHFSFLFDLLFWCYPSHYTPSIHVSHTVFFRLIPPSPTLASLHWDWSSPSRSASPPKHSRLLPIHFPPSSLHLSPTPNLFHFHTLDPWGATSLPKSLCAVGTPPPLKLRVYEQRLVRRVVSLLVNFKMGSLKTCFRPRDHGKSSLIHCLISLSAHTNGRQGIACCYILSREIPMGCSKLSYQLSFL